MTPRLNLADPPQAVRAPVAAAERAPLPDVLRGLALGGILIVNLQDFAGYSVWQQAGADRFIQVLIDVFVNGKAISLFAMLFGWGAAGMLARSGAGTLARRLLVLLAVGTLHYIFVWHGDIIANYAVVAIGLLLLGRLPVRGLVGLAAALAGVWWLPLFTEGLNARRLWGEGGRWSDIENLGGTTYAAIMGERAGEFVTYLGRVVAFDGLWLLALMLLGAAAHKSGLLARPAEHRPALRALLIGGLLVGLPLAALLAYTNSSPTAWAGVLALPARMGGGLALALAYTGGLGLWLAAGRGRGLAPLAWAGRMAMSNYIAQSLLCTTLFYPYGLAQSGRWGALACLGLALTLYPLQVWFSGLWLRCFRQGPLEGLVRLLVYGRR